MIEIQGMLQFQYGSIRSKIALKGDGTEETFQFQHGSIGSSTKF